MHVPDNEHTRHLVNAERLRLAQNGLILLNFARAGIVDEAAVVEALDSGRVARYICDFPSNALRGRGDAIALPHLGASTVEAEENCAVMVADQIREFLENGNVTNSVNFPDIALPRGDKGDRLTVANANVPNMLGQISSTLAAFDLNIDDMYNKSRGDIAYTVVDVEGRIPEEVASRIRTIDGVLAVRVLGD